MSSVYLFDRLGTCQEANKIFVLSGGYLIIRLPHHRNPKI